MFGYNIGNTENKRKDKNIKNKKPQITVDIEIDEADLEDLDYEWLEKEVNRIYEEKLKELEEEEKKNKENKNKSYTKTNNKINNSSEDFTQEKSEEVETEYISQRTKEEKSEFEDDNSEENKEETVESNDKEIEESNEEKIDSEEDEDLILNEKIDELNEKNEKAKCLIEFLKENKKTSFTDERLVCIFLAVGDVMSEKSLEIKEGMELISQLEEIWEQKNANLRGGLSVNEEEGMHEMLLHLYDSAILNKRISTTDESGRKLKEYLMNLAYINRKIEEAEEDNEIYQNSEKIYELKQQKNSNTIKMYSELHKITNKIFTSILKDFIDMNKENEKVKMK